MFVFFVCVETNLIFEHLQNQNPFSYILLHRLYMLYMYIYKVVYGWPRDLALCDSRCAGPTTDSTYIVALLSHLCYCDNSANSLCRQSVITTYWLYGIYIAHVYYIQFSSYHFAAYHHTTPWRVICIDHCIEADGEFVRIFYLSFPYFLT